MADPGSGGPREWRAGTDYSAQRKSYDFVKVVGWKNCFNFRLEMLKGMQRGEF